MIEFQDVSKIYEGDIAALKKLSFKVSQGEFVFLTGPSGAGKSTLLRLIHRAEIATQGRVLVDGVDVGRIPHSKVPALRRKMGFIFQDFKLLYERSVFENVAFALEVLGLPAPEIRRETHVVLEQVGLDTKAHLKPHKLSGGEQQRVAVARALVHDPALLLADEPTGNLDAETSWEIMKLLQGAHEKGATVLVASHSLGIIEKMGHRIIHLRGGQLDAVKEGVAHE